MGMGSRARVSVIIPTIGRPTLARAIRSVAVQMERDDEILVIGDGPQPEAARMADGARSAFPRLKIQCMYDVPTGRWGHAQRQSGMLMASGSHMAFLDDDDIWGPHARMYIEHVTSQCPSRPIIFRMVTPEGRLLWSDPEVRMGNVGTPMIVVPNEPSKLGTWGTRYEGDFDFISSLKWDPADLVWSTYTVCICRPVGKCWFDSPDGPAA